MIFTRPPPPPPFYSSAQTTTIHDKLGLSDTEGGKFFWALGAIEERRQTLYRRISWLRRAANVRRKATLPCLPVGTNLSDVSGLGGAIERGALKESKAVTLPRLIKRRSVQQSGTLSPRNGVQPGRKDGGAGTGRVLFLTGRDGS